LYWFNLSANSLAKFPDTWEPMMRIGREIKMLSPFYLAGDAYQFERRRNALGKLDWDCASIVSEECALLFALDLAYEPSDEDNTFQFGEARDFSYCYDLPHWLRQPTDVFRVDADGLHEVNWTIEGRGVRIQHQCSRDAVFVATKSANLRTAIEARRQTAMLIEERNKVAEDSIKLPVK
jgi:hypothetical protein